MRRRKTILDIIFIAIALATYFFSHMLLADSFTFTFGYIQKIAIIIGVFSLEFLVYSLISTQFRKQIRLK